MLGRGAQGKQFYFLMVTRYLPAELIEERRGMDVAKSASSPEAFYAEHTLCLTLGPCFMTSPHISFLLLELRPNARWVGMKSSRHSQGESNLRCLQVQAQLLL